MAAPADVHVVLRDGSTAHVRPVVPADAPAVKEFLTGLSDDSRWLRFFSLGVNLDKAAERAAAGDRPEGYGLIVTMGPEERVVAHAVFEVDRPGRAEVAFAVADELQGRGMATVLLAHLAQVADARGIATFTANVLPENRRMIGVFRESGFPVHVRPGPDAIEIEFPTEMGEGARRRFEDRDRVAAVAAVERILRPRSVAVIGASRRPDSFGGAVFRHALAGGFRGELYPVNPNADFVGSRRASPSVRETPGPVDLAIVAVPAYAVPHVARECAEAGVAALVVITAGFAEAGAEGAARQEELLAACRAGGMRLVGPNCMGVVNADPEVSLSATFARAQVPPGTVGFASQSGAFGIAAIDRVAGRGIGLSAFVSFGDKADLSGNDVLQYWEQDSRTEVVALYLESFGNPRKFGRVARRVSRTKPVLVVKAGRRAAAVRAAGSRTGALLAASDTAVEALFASAGVIRCDGLDDMLDAATVLAEQPLPRGGRVGIVANARGPTVVCADACADAGLEVAALASETQAALRELLPPESVVSGPVQLVAVETPERFRAAVERVAADPGVDAVIAIFVEHMPRGAAGAAEALAQWAPAPRGEGAVGGDADALAESSPAPRGEGAVGGGADALAESSPAPRGEGAVGGGVGAFAESSPAPRGEGAVGGGAGAFAESSPPLRTEGTARGAAGAAYALAWLAPALRAAGTPLVAVFMTPDALPGVLRRANVPAFAAPEAAARALGRAAAYARRRAAPAAEPEPPPDCDPDAVAALLARALARGGGWLGPDEVEELLRAYGLPLVEQRRVGSAAAAARAAAELGGPLALKGAAPAVVHKARARAVRLDLVGPSAVRRAAREISERLDAAGYSVESFVVQRMAEPGVEMLVGMLADERFGPVVACGAGGDLVELIGDVQVRLAPIAREEAAAMVRGLRTFALLERERAAVAALEDVAVRVGALADAHPEIAELDCNPVIVSRSGAVIVDARVRVTPPAIRRLFPAVGA